MSSDLIRHQLSSLPTVPLSLLLQSVVRHQTSSRRGTQHTIPPRCAIPIPMHPRVGQVSLARCASQSLQTHICRSPLELLPLSLPFSAKYVRPSTCPNKKSFFSGMSWCARARILHRLVSVKYAPNRTLITVFAPLACHPAATSSTNRVFSDHSASLTQPSEHAQSAISHCVSAVSQIALRPIAALFSARSVPNCEAKRTSNWLNAMNLLTYIPSKSSQQHSFAFSRTIQTSTPRKSGNAGMIGVLSRIGMLASFGLLSSCSRAGARRHSKVSFSRSATLLSNWWLGRNWYGS